MTLLSRTHAQTFILLSLVLLLSVQQWPSVAQAAPSSTLVKVQELRARFKDAIAPTVRDLHLGEDWDCRYWSALEESGEEYSVPAYYRFMQSSDGRGIVLKDDPAMEPYRFTSTALVAAEKWGSGTVGFDHIRIGEQGELLVEFTLPHCSGFGCLFPLIRKSSVDDCWAFAIGYRECRLPQ